MSPEQITKLEEMVMFPVRAMGIIKWLSLFFGCLLCISGIVLYAALSMMSNDDEEDEASSRRHRRIRRQRMISDM
jgi:hypothetical protein